MSNSDINEDIESTGQPGSPLSVPRMEMFSPDGAALRMSEGYRYLEDSVNQTSSSPHRWIWKLMGLWGSAAGAAGEGAQLSGGAPGVITQTISIKNDANIIIIPLSVRVPTNQRFNHGFAPMCPGETSSCRLEYTLQNVHTSQNQIFSFVVINTDQNFLSGQFINIATMVVHITISRSGSHVRISRVDLGDSGSSVVLRDDSLNYVEINGPRGSTLPSFGIAMIRVRMPTQVTQWAGPTITFTPSGVRA